MLGVSLKIWTMLLKDLFKRFSIDWFMVIRLWFHVDFWNFFDKKFIFFIIVCKILLLQIASEEWSSYQALNDSIHIACVSNVVETWKLVDLVFFGQIFGVKFLEILIVLYCFLMIVPILIDVFYRNVEIIFNFNNLSPIENTVNWKINLSSIIFEPFFQNFSILDLINVIVIGK
jgi:hypothetical protein